MMMYTCVRWLSWHDGDPIGQQRITPASLPFISGLTLVSAPWGKRLKNVCFVVKRRPLDTFMSLRFKLSCHDLGVELRRWKKRTPRDQRFCKLCQADCIGDEHCRIFMYTTFVHIRKQFLHLIRGHRVDANIHRVFANRDQLSFTEFLWDCFRYREHHMSV